MPAGETQNPTIECVVLTAFDGEFAFLRNIFRFAGIRMHRADCLEQADFLLMTTCATVILSDLALADCSWRAALERIRKYHPLVAALLVADPVDVPFVQDAFTRGACGVLWKPIELDAGARMIRIADEASRERTLLREELIEAQTVARAEAWLSIARGRQ